MVKSFQDKIKAYTLENALSHNGKAVVQAVLGHLFKEGLKKQDIKQVMPLINTEVKKVNSLSLEEQKKEFSNLDKLVKKASKQRQGLPELVSAVKGKVVTRLAPEPSKYNHLGHALSFLLNYVYSKKYNGKCILKFEDANPEKVSKEYVDAMKQDIIDYLGIKVSKTIFISDDIPRLYKYAEKLIKIKKAYMCFCKREEMQKLRRQGIECSCGLREVNDNLKEWKKFLNGDYMNGKAVLRLKGNMQSNNAVMRDPVIFRALKAKHYRQGEKYKIWPMFDFYNPIEDSLIKVTHILRSNEFNDRLELQNYILKLLKLKKQIIVQYGRFNVIGSTTKGREIRELIDSGDYTGWDDPRLMTLKALKKRGIIKETFYELIEQIGLSKYQVNLDFDMIASINRKLIDKSSDRYSFIQEPIKLEVNKKPDIKQISVGVHPEKKQTRKINLQSSIYVSRKDYEMFSGKEIRLMHLFNIALKKNNKAEFTSKENKDIQKVQWVSDFVNARILMPDGSWISGIAEKAIEKLKPEAIIQFERVGFVKFDKINKAGEYEFRFAHR
ncbi:MAG: glutamate--tRNA ligase [Nanoarchaeota archaeon]|nr:glutamate--tRNA ligase [Nanoarchaeota archaeon]